MHLFLDFFIVDHSLHFNLVIAQLILILIQIFINKLDLECIFEIEPLQLYCKTFILILIIIDILIFIFNLF